MCSSSIERSAPTSETTKLQARKSRVAAFLPRCIFNLAMNEVLHRLSKYDCRWRYAMQPFAVGEKTYQARIRRTALSIYRQQAQNAIIQQWKSASLRRTKVPTTATINHAGRKRADKDRLGKTAIAQTQQSCGSRMIKIHSAVPGGGESKRKSAVWLTVFPERRLA